MAKTPNSIASVVILIISKLSKADICEKCGISLPTLTKIETIVKSYLEETSV